MEATQSILMELISVSMNRWVSVGADLSLCFTMYLPCIGPRSTFHQGHLTAHKRPKKHLFPDSLIIYILQSFCFCEAMEDAESQSVFFVKTLLLHVVQTE